MKFARKSKIAFNGTASKIEWLTVINILAN
jgi:hypothetical protein